ncbi:MAG: CAP domain-containing protein [Pseudomonadota bacterium]
MPFRPLILATAFVALAACGAPPGTERMSMGSTVDIASVGTQLSVQRAGNGILRPLAHSPALQAAAQAHADDLARTGRFAHTGSDGSSVAERARRANYNACALAENIAQGQPDIRSVITAWMGSEGHRRNILDAQVTQFGFAESAGNWVLVLGRPC